MFPYMIALLISLFAGQWSHLCLVLFFSQRSTSEKRLMQSSNKRGRTMCWCSSEKLLHKSEGCLYKGFWSRTRVCMIVAMHGCAVYTLSLLILWISTHSRKHRNAHTISEEFPFSFSIWFLTHTKFHADMFQFTRTHPNAHMPTPLPAMYLSGLPCCLSNQRMGSFQLHWSEHIIPFPSSPLLNTQIHATHTYWNTHHHPTHSPGGTMLPTVNPKDWCVSLDKMRLCVITRHYTTEPPSNSIS